MDTFFNNVYFIRLLIRWRIHLIIVFTIALVCSFIFSGPYFIKPKYKSYTTIYPSNLQSYSSETVTEQMLQIFRSDDIKDAVIKDLKLAQHYEIDTTDKYFNSKITREWESNVSIRRTEFEAVRIEVMDIDPKIACQIVEKMVDLFNLKVQKIFRAKKAENVKILSDELEAKRMERETLKAKLLKLSTDYHLIDYTQQAKEATREYVKTNNKNSPANMIIKNLEQMGGEFRQVSNQFENTLNAYNNIKLEYDNELKDLTKQLTYTTIIDKAFPADQKCYPIRWLIVVITCIGSILITLLVITSIEKYKSIVE